MPSFMAAVAMHSLLVFGMWFAVQWRTSSEAPAVAELWDPLPAIEQPAPPPPPPAPPQPEAPKPEADIVEKQQVKPHAPEQESPPPPERRPIEKKEPKKAEPKKENKPTPQQIEREQRQAEERRQAEIARVTGQVVGTAHAPLASSGVISNTYAALINACIRPHIVFAVPEGVSDQLYAEFKVDLLATGEQASHPVLIKPSGLPGYDDAAERAIIRCDPFPRDRDGTVPRSFTLKMYPTETR